MLQVRLKELREREGISQYKLAADLGVAQSTVGMWENGKNKPEYATLNAIADYFQVSVDYLLGRDMTAAASGTPLEGVDFALYGETKDLSEEEKQDILAYIRFKKSQRR
jgi:transcriptional regulator with XRE-family HTH domain